MLKIIIAAIIWAILFKSLLQLELIWNYKITRKMRKLQKKYPKYGIYWDGRFENTHIHVRYETISIRMCISFRYNYDATYEDKAKYIMSMLEKMCEKMEKTYAKH